MSSCPAIRRPAGGPHYDRRRLIAALGEVGVRCGDVLFSHAGIGLLGRPAEGHSFEAAAGMVCRAVRDAIGPAGTWLVPTYSYSFCKGEVYDPQETPSDVGEFTERFRRLPGVRRSRDPIFSVAGLGPQAESLFRDLPPDCFGPDCLYARLVRRGAKICNLGVGFRYATLVHHVEQMLGVPYRSPKVFTGQIRDAGGLRTERWTYNVRRLIPEAWPDLRRLERRAREQGPGRTARLGRGEITCIDCRDLYELCAAGIRDDPWFLASGPPVDSGPSGR